MEYTHNIALSQSIGERGEVVIRIDLPSMQPGTSQASPLISFAESGLEKETLRGLVRSGRLEAVRLGRRWYLRRADLLRLFDELAAEQKPTKRKLALVTKASGSPSSALAQLAASTRKAAR